MLQGHHGGRAVTARPLAPRILLNASLILTIAAGCSSDEQPVGRSSGNANNHPPVVKAVSILPAPVVLSSPLTVRVDAQDLDGQNVLFRYRWLINGQVAAGQTDVTLPSQILKRGDQVAVEVTPFDGIIEGAAFRSAMVPVANTPPIIQHASIEADQSVRGRRIVATVKVDDLDHDPVTVTYQWRLGDKVLQEGEANTLEIAGLTASDVIRLVIEASDGAPNGVSAASSQFRLANSPPVIISQPPSIQDGGQYAYLVQANDADNDSIAYTLEVSPPGMSIDSKTGQVRWIVPPDLQGSHRIRVVAQDDRGGIAAQEFDLSLMPPSVPPDQQADKS